MHTVYKKLKPYLILFFVLLLAYLPVATFHFGMKNDAFSDNFPNKYFLSQALHSGMLPLWNPYMNFGLPVYADPGFAFWNPITWIFGFAGYSSYTLTIEVLLYIYLAGITMFALGKTLGFSSRIAIVTAAMYMCSGFFTGSLQYINFLSGAAFLPCVVLFFLRTLRHARWTDSFALAVSGYMIFAGGHPAIPFATVYFLLLLGILLLLFEKQYRQNWRAITLSLFAAMALFLLMASPALYSYATLYPWYARDAARQVPALQNTGFSPSSYLSFFFPVSTLPRTNLFPDDVAMRNAFISFAGIVAAAWGVLSRNKTSIAFVITGCCLLVFALGGSFKIALFSHLPLLDYVRTNGEYRLFPVLCFTVAAGYGLEIIGARKLAAKKYTLVLQLFAALLALTVLTTIAANSGAFRQTISGLSTTTGATAKIKWFFDNGPFPFFFAVSIMIEFVVLLASVYFLRKNSFRRFLLCMLADLVINAVLCLPVTGVGQVTLAHIQQFYDSMPPGIPVPPPVPVRSIDTLDWKTTGLLGDITYYNKKIGTQRLTDYPSYLKETDSFFHSPWRSQVMSMPYLFLQSDLANKMSPKEFAVRHFAPTHIGVTVQSKSSDTMILLQNYYPRWHATVNGEAVTISPKYLAFMSVPVGPGENQVEFYYRDDIMWLWLLISVLTFVLGAVFSVRYGNNADRPAASTQHTHSLIVPPVRKEEN